MLLWVVLTSNLFLFLTILFILAPSANDTATHREAGCIPDAQVGLNSVQKAGNLKGIRRLSERCRRCLAQVAYVLGNTVWTSSCYCSVSAAPRVEFLGSHLSDKYSNHRATTP